MERELKSRLAAAFAGEAARRVAVMNRDLMSLQASRESGDAERLLEGLVREAHSLKGAADAAGVQPVHVLAGRAEALFGRMRAGELLVRPAVCEAAFRALDAMVLVARDPTAKPDVARIAADLDDLGEEGGPATLAVAPAPQPDAGVLVDATRLDALLRAIDELAAALAASERRLAELRTMAEELREPRPAAPPAPAEPKPGVILLAENSETTRALQKHLLEHAGYEVRAAADGSEAWNLLAAGQVDVVVSDILMPGIDGFDLTAMIRADERLGDLPVVLITATDSQDRRERAVEVGANEFIVKGSSEYENLVGIVRGL